jgi:hypothetical protein
MFEIWQHAPTGRRYLVALHGTQVLAVAGPLHPWEDAARVLERHSNQDHNAQAMLDIRRHPHDYRRVYTTGKDKRAVAVAASQAAIPAP